jgi:hypothetical protein
VYYPITISYEFGSHWMALDYDNGLMYERYGQSIGGLEELFLEGQVPIGFECLPQRAMIFTAKGEWHINE